MLNNPSSERYTNYNLQVGCAMIVLLDGGSANPNSYTDTNKRRNNKELLIKDNEA